MTANLDSSVGHFDGLAMASETALSGAVMELKLLGGCAALVETHLFVLELGDISASTEAVAAFFELLLRSEP